MLNKKSWPIGLEVSAQALRGAQLAWVGKKWKAIGAGAVSLPADLAADGPRRQEQLLDALNELLATGGFNGKQVVSCLASSAMQYKNLRLPPMPPDELRSAVEWEAADRLKLDKQYRIQYFDVGEVRQGDELRREIVLLAAPARAVDEHVALLQKAGLEPQAIDAAPAALARWAAAFDADPESTQCLLDIDAATSSVLISRQGKVLFFKPIDIGTRNMDEAIAARLNLSRPDATDARRARFGATGAAGNENASDPRRDQIAHAVADALRSPLTELAREIGLCLRYYGVTFRGRRPESLQVVGEAAREPLLAELLPSAAGLSLAASEPGEVMDWSSPSASAAPAAPAMLAVASGLSMRSQDREAQRGAA